MLWQINSFVKREKFFTRLRKQTKISDKVSLFVFHLTALS